ncbi:unnamed protein product [Rotaria sordida]|uniref:G-protein coupled receptors family 1 profile domain-containing protein n=1 Tax=Rotaria sordida TaxID=392033 RepID=A0A815MJU6_9BILA|nr:unnamed protein product [Rotaria sordida]CAF4024142.1 unnamed protein product [Rotaria sordida]
MNSSCYITADSKIILSFFIIGFFLSIIGCILNLCSCLLFIRTKSLFNTPYAIFIIALSLVDIIKIIAEYFIHLLFIYIQHPYFVCSITWFLTMTSENISYAFLGALGIERNLKVWTIDRRWLITRPRACLITLFIILFIIIYNHPFLFWPSDVSYCYFLLFNHITVYTCNNANYYAYGYSFSLTKLLLIENMGLNNIILPLIIILTNIILVIGLKRRNYQRRHHLGTNKINDWRERSILIYMLLSSITFIILTLPVGILFVWGIIFGKQIPTNNFVLICDLMEIIHHCSHFPILLMTSSKIRRKVCEYRYKQGRNISFGSRSRSQTQSSNHHDRCLTIFRLCLIDLSSDPS